MEESCACAGGEREGKSERGKKSVLLRISFHPIVSTTPHRTTHWSILINTSIKMSESENKSDSKKITMEQLKEHGSHDDLWLLIDGKVYDVSKFLDEHPGGDEVLVTEAGKDATEAFEDVGHSEDARALLGPMFVGELEGGVSTTFPLERPL